MAGTVVTTERTLGVVKKITFAWTSGSGGDAGKADATTTGVYDGKIIAVLTDPDGTTAPTDNYGVEIKDSDGLDLCATNCLLRDTANTEIVASTSLGAVAKSTLTLAVTSAGSAKLGVCVVWIR